MSLNVRVITPDKVVWDADTEELILPSSTGQLGILTGHAPLLTALDIGVMRLKTGSKLDIYCSNGRFCRSRKGYSYSTL